MSAIKEFNTCRASVFGQPSARRVMRPSSPTLTEEVLKAFAIRANRTNTKARKAITARLVSTMHRLLDNIKT